MDPKLAARFARQKEKEELGDELPVTEIGSAANCAKQLDPVLAMRWAKQKEREQSGEAFVDEIRSAADTTTKVESVLAKRWSKLAEEGAPVQEVRSAATVTRQLDPVLAKAWAKQQEEGHSASLAGEIGSAAKVTRQLDPVLAKAFARQQQREAGIDPNEAVAADLGEAERLHVSIKAGGTFSHSIPWRGGAQSISWSAVVLDDLTVDLEISANLAPPSSGEGLRSIVLQRNARGVNFVSEFFPARKRGLAVPEPAAAMSSTSSGRSTGSGRGTGQAAASSTAAAPVAAPPVAAGEVLARQAPEHQVVESIVFNFSNAFSWFTAKEIEFVTLFS